MPGGMAINRQWVFVLKDGTIIMDWGDGRAVDLARGEFIEFKEATYSHPVQDNELEVLRRMGRVASFDSLVIFVTSMPELPHEPET
jgi:hypothetical protein